MKILILLVLLFSACTPTYEFNYGEPVKIKSGFYRGCKGHINSFSRGLLSKTPHSYDIELEYQCDRKIISVRPNEIEALP